MFWCPRARVFVKNHMRRFGEDGEAKFSVSVTDKTGMNQAVARPPPLVPVGTLLYGERVY